MQIDKIKKELNCSNSLILRGEPEGTRTPNLLVRSQMLYPIKLQVLLFDGRKYNKNWKK